MNTFDRGLPPGDTTRYESLDGIRGIAALSVVLGHCFGSLLPEFPILHWLPTRALYASHSAVIIFFVLSGFALFMLFDSSKKSYGVFIASRWLRIYPPYLFSIAVAITFITISKLAGANRFGGYPSFDLQNILEHLILIGPIDISLYNGVIWSLVHEMRISIIFPIIYWAIKKNLIATITIFTGSSIAIAASHYDQIFSEKYSELVGIAATVHYTTFFAYGAAIAKSRFLISRWVQQLSPYQLLVSAMLPVAGFAYLPPDHINIGRGWLIDIAVAISSAGILVIAIGTSFLKSSYFQYLGKISFSLYLIHGPIGILLTSLAENSDTFSFPSAIFSVILSIISAEIMWRLIETKSLKWSRKARQSSSLKERQIN